ncbi:hypothetical protein [Streptomyces sp. NPDC087525]
MAGSIRNPNATDKKEVADKNRQKENKAALAQRMKDKIKGSGN